MTSCQNHSLSESFDKMAASGT